MTYCPLGPERGCELDPGTGTCTDMEQREDRRFCRGNCCWICTPAYDAWVEQGKPELPQEELARLHSIRQRPVAPDLPPPAQPLPSVLERAPAGLGNWEAYAPHEKGPRGFHDENQQHLLALARSYAGMFHHGPRQKMSNLVLLGHNGTGKTLLLRILGRQAALLRWRVVFAVFQEVLLQVKAARGPQAPESEDQILRPLMEADLLILDDVRSVFDSQDDENTVNRILAARYGEDRGQLPRPTFVSSQLSVSELTRVLGSSAARRLFQDGAVKPFACDWPPFRKAVAL